MYNNRSVKPWLHSAGKADQWAINDFFITIGSYTWIQRGTKGKNQSY